MGGAQKLAELTGSRAYERFTGTSLRGFLVVFIVCSSVLTMSAIACWSAGMVIWANS